MKSHTVKLLFLVAIIHILFISTNTVAGLTLTNNGSTDFAYFGDTINYDYKLVNDNGVDLHDVVFYDDHFGSIAIGNLNNGATWTLKTIPWLHYTIMVKNNAQTTMAARLTDQLPGGMSLLGASPAPENYDGNYIHWVLPELRPNEILTILYNVLYFPTF